MDVKTLLKLIDPENVIDGLTFNNVLDLDNRLSDKQKTIIDAFRKLYNYQFKKVSGPESIADELIEAIGYKDSEHFLCVYLDTKNQVLEQRIEFKGTIDRCNVSPREIVKRALELNAKSIIMAHNHPSGDVEPSNADLAITKTIKTSLNLFNINLIDHIIVSRSNIRSMRDQFPYSCN